MKLFKLAQNFAVLLLPFLAASALANPIRLGAIDGLEVITGSEGPVMLTATKLEGYVYIENLAYEKDVRIHYRVGNTWQNVPATYVATLDNGLEKWSFSTPLWPLPLGSQVGTNYEVGFSYGVNGQVYGIGSNILISAGPRGIYPSHAGE